MVEQKVGIPDFEKGGVYICSLFIRHPRLATMGKNTIVHWNIKKYKPYLESAITIDYKFLI